eukprot:TRINITY_DN8745_c0_g3_i1.p2 TRINITY_DN8745_c0_g3~~TRINITY_DN8745_c0_g3_i1.p2  ORF type:complete len:114 (-),score=32.93 TRINITY_DN8745_c0_g3_i1:912-1253(-)
MSDDPRKQQSQQQPRRQTPGRGSSGDSGSAGTASSSSSAQYPLNDGSDVATFTPVNQVTYLSIGPRSVGPSLLSSAPGGIASHFAPLRPWWQRSHIAVFEALIGGQRAQSGGR